VLGARRRLTALILRALGARVADWSEKLSRIIFGLVAIFFGRCPGTRWRVTRWRVTRLTVAVDGCGKGFAFPTSAPTSHLEERFAFFTSRLEKASPFPHSPPQGCCCWLIESWVGCPGSGRLRAGTDVRDRVGFGPVGCPGSGRLRAETDVRDRVGFGPGRMSGVGSASGRSDVRDRVGFGPVGYRDRVVDLPAPPPQPLATNSSSRGGWRCGKRAAFSKWLVENAQCFPRWRWARSWGTRSALHSRPPTPSATSPSTARGARR